MESVSNFRYSGLASLDDLTAPAWGSLFNELEKAQAVFNEHSNEFRSKDYTWGAYPLFHPTRLWEYPWVFENLRNFLAHRSTKKVLDFGSGVTYFPFYLSSLNYHITATDIDPLCERDFNKAIDVYKHNNKVSGSIEFNIFDTKRLPFDNECFDACYCISVIEHIYENNASPESSISEIYRVLKPDGIFLLTVDIDKNGTSELSPEHYNEFKKILLDYFDYEVPEKVIHPLKVLDTFNSPRPLFKNRIHYIGKKVTAAIKDILGIPRMKLYNVATESFILRKR